MTKRKHAATFNLDNSVRCKYCGKSGFEWRRTKSSGNWRLYPIGHNRPHHCPVWVAEQKKQMEEIRDADQCPFDPEL